MSSETTVSLNPTDNNPVTLSEIRTILERAEDSIIFALLERSQWRHNQSIYQQQFDQLFQATEVAQAQAGRYTCPEETPFTNANRYAEYQPSHGRPYRLTSYLSTRHLGINYNQIIRTYYFDQLLPQITEAGQDENPGSSVVSDISLLQAVSRRVHLGKVVAESKLRRDPEFSSRRGLSDVEILEAITDTIRERQVLDRLRDKATQYLGIFQRTRSDHGLDDSWVEAIHDFYRDFVIPTTKLVQVDYLRPIIGLR